MAKSRWELEENRKKKALAAMQAALKSGASYKGNAVQNTVSSAAKNNFAQSSTAKSTIAKAGSKSSAQRSSSGGGGSRPASTSRQTTTTRSNTLPGLEALPSFGSLTLRTPSASAQRQNYLSGASERRRTNVDSRTGRSRAMDERDLQLNMARWHNTNDEAERQRLNRENDAIRARLGLSYDPRTGVTYNARTGRNYSLPTQLLYGGTAAQRARAANQFPYSREAAGEDADSISMRPTMQQIAAGVGREASGVNAHQVMADLFSRGAEEWSDEDTRNRDAAVQALSDEMDRIMQQYGLQYSESGLGTGAWGMPDMVSDRTAIDRLREAGADETTLAYVQENINLREAANRFGQGAEAAFKRTVGSPKAFIETVQQQAANVAESRENPEYVQLEAEKQQLENQLTSMPSTNYDGSLNQDYLDVYNRLQAVQQRMQEIAVQTPVDQNKWGQTMLREAAEAQANATAGLSAVPRFLANQGISIAGNAPGMAASLIPGVGPAVGATLMGVQAAGQRAQELNAQGASPSEALARGISSGLIEAVTEKLPIDTLADILNRGGTDAVRSILRQMGIEAGEESASYMMNLASDWAAADPNAQFSFADLAEQALGGAISGGVYGGAGTLIGRAGAQTAQETAAAPREENYSPVMQETVRDIQAQIQETPQETAQPTDSQAFGQTYTGMNDFTAPLTQTLVKIDEQMRIAENLPAGPARENRIQALQKGAQDVSRQLAAIENNRAEIARAQTIAERFGAKFALADLGPAGGKYENGTITINPYSSSPVRQVLVHELTHHLETSGQYDVLQRQALGMFAAEQGVDVDTLRANIMQLYAQNGVQLDVDGANRELTAAFCENRLFTDEASIQRLAQTDRNLFERIRQWIADTVARLRGTPEQREMLRLQQMYERAARTVGQREGYRGAQYSIDGRSTLAAQRAYREAVESGDTQTAEEILRQTYRIRGYSPDIDNRMMHVAPNSKDGYSARLDDLTPMYGDDIYSPDAEYYFGTGESYDGAAIAAIQNAHNHPDALVTVYRAIPSSVQDYVLRNGDWVTTVEDYAREHGERTLEGAYRIIRETVPARYLYGNGDSIFEFGYDNGNNEVYRNAVGNAKTAGVTYDDYGDLIPLSQRFDERNPDRRYTFGFTPAQIATAPEVQVPLSSAIRYGATPEQAMREAEVRAQGEAAQAAARSEREETVSGLMQAWTDKRAAEKQAEQTLAGLTLTDNDIRLAQNAAMSGVDTVNWEYADNPEKAYLYGKTLRAVREADQPIRQYFAQRAAAIQSEAQKAADAIATHAKDKRWGAAYQRETMERNIRDIFGKEHQAEAEAIIREYITPVHQAVAEGNKLKNSLRDRVKKLKLNKHERALVQMRLEAEDGAAAEYIKNNNLTVTPEMDAKINQAVQVFRDIYNDLYNQINETLLLNGQEPAPFRKNYAPHFTKDKPDTLLGKVRFALGLGKDSSLNVPTDIAGITDSFRPGKKWFGNLLQREGEITDYDAVAGFDQYIETAADVITLTESIQKLRALEDQVRYTLSDEGVQAKIDAIRANPELDALQQRQQIEEVYDTNRSSVQQLIDDLRNQKRMGMGRFVTELRRYTDNLAGKKSREDRGWEDMANRQVYQLAKNLESRVAANMISLNPGSWLTNLIPITQATGEVSVPNLVKGMYQTVKGAVTDDGYRDASAFLTNRYGSDRLDKTLAQRASDLSGAPMELIDHFVANTIHRARYAQNIDKGMSMDAAIKDADAYTASLMADRSKGALPTAFNATNPIRKVFTMFQTEVNNQLSYLFKDMPKAQRKKGVAAVAWAYTKVFGTAYLFNLAYSALTGRDAALDPVGIIADALGIGDDEDEERSGWDVAADLGMSVAQNLPFVGGLLDGGRVPISSAFPNPVTIWNSLSGDAAPEKKAQTVGKELAKPLTYLLPKFGGGAARRAIEGYATIDAGGSYTYDSDGNRVLQFPAYGQKPQDYARAMLFGKWSSEEAQEYIENGFKGLSADETVVFDQLRNDMGLDARQAMDTILSLRGFESVKDSEGNTVQTVKDQQRLALFDNENLTPEQKAAVDRALIVSGEDEQPADYSDRNAFLLGQYVSESRRDAARSALETGLSIDQFVQWDKRLSELTDEKDENDKKVRTEAEARGIVLDEVMQDATLSDGEKQAIADYVLISSIGEEDEKTREDWETIAKGKVNATDYLRFKDDVSIYEKQAKGSGTDNMANVAEILRGYDGLTDQERDVLFQTFNSTMKNNPFHVSEYEQAVQDNQFYKDLSEEGKSALRALTNEYEQAVNDGKELKDWVAKAYMADKEADIAPGVYALYRVALQTINAQASSDDYYSQDEVKAAVNTIPGLTQYQKAYLWQSANKKWKKNPFGSATVGEYQSGVQEAINPVESGTQTSAFGPREAPTAGASTWHDGLDIAASEGEPVKAILSGKVVAKDYDYGGGYYVKIDHGDGRVSTYMHMQPGSTDGINVGDEIKQGQQIGAVGNTGEYSTGPHLDIRITKDGKYIDPLTVIPGYGVGPSGYVSGNTASSSAVASGVASAKAAKSSGSSGSSKSSGLKSLKGFKRLPTF